MNHDPIHKTNGDDAPEGMAPGRRLVPPVDIYENAEEILMHLDVPGASQGSLSLRLEDGRLDLEARQDLGAAKDWLEPVTFVRSFTLPASIDEQKVAAELDGGVLTIRLPKADHAKPRRIAVKTN